ncbi:MAG: hypothetical protein U0640_01700 [Phycisphaerales bacterium]
MILTLSARCLRSMLLPPGKGKKSQLDLLDLPKYTRETLGLSGVNFSTDLLAGADRSKLEAIRERADRSGCACLLLVEYEAQDFGSSNESTVGAATERALRVVQAAQILGCSAAAIKVKAPDDDTTLTRVAAVLKPVVERAEKLDINLLISPEKGLTERPDRVTELLKKVGGFRIGTYPDFEVAAAAKDPVAYLHRLTPYATAVCATTVKLIDPAGEPIAVKPKKSAKAATPAKTETAEPAAEEPATGKKGKGKKAAAPPPPPEPEPEEDPELDDAELDELEALIDEAIEEEEPELVAWRHEPYDLAAMVNAISSVGYDGPLSIEYRGKEDVTQAIIQSRDTLLALIAAAKNAG